MPPPIVTAHLARALAALAPAPPPPGVTRYLGLYAPSFHPEVLVTVDCPSGQVAELRFASFSERTPAARGPSAGPDEPRKRREARAVVGEARAGALRRLLDPLVPAGLLDTRPGLGLDGVSLLGALTAADGTTASFEAWSPRPGTPPHTYFAALHALAREVLTQESAQLRLEQLHGYLELGPPLVDLGGAPRHLRIFGHLTLDDEAALRDFFAAAPLAAPVLVDLRNFEGMGAALYPLFRAFDRAPRPIAWVAPAPVQRGLLAAGVTPSHLFSGMDDAAQALAGRAEAPGPPAG